MCHNYSLSFLSSFIFLLDLVRSSVYFHALRVKSLCYVFLAYPINAIVPNILLKLQPWFYQGWQEGINPSKHTKYSSSRRSSQALVIKHCSICSRTSQNTPENVQISFPWRDFFERNRGKYLPLKIIKSCYHRDDSSLQCQICLLCKYYRKYCINTESEV